MIYDFTQGRRVVAEVDYCTSVRPAGCSGKWTFPDGTIGEGRIAGASGGDKGHRIDVVVGPIWGAYADTLSTLAWQLAPAPTVYAMVLAGWLIARFRRARAHRMTREFNARLRPGQELYHARDAEITDAHDQSLWDGRHLGHRLAVLDGPGPTAFHIRHGVAARYFYYPNGTYAGAILRDRRMHPLLGFALCDARGAAFAFTASIDHPLSWQVTGADGSFVYARILITTQGHTVAVEPAAPPLLRPLIFGFVIEYDRIVFEAGDGLGLEYRHHIAR
ncbi:hypothetical protein [Nocardia fusca]|uniref:hypothetical protein n=1 Tax=Nocardia fusca TaxID=941183 RepID=UPI0012F48808|nr:hypothetical protein [Nocardia fusca]